MAVGWYRQIFPPDPPPPEYGLLPPLDIPQVQLPPTLTFKLETPDGSANVQNLKNTFGRPLEYVKVYFMPQTLPNLLGPERVKERAGALGFVSEPESVGPNVARFRKGNPPAVLDIHSLTQAFRLYRPVNPGDIIKTPPKSTEEAHLALNNFLKGALLPEEISKGEPKYRFLRASGNGYSEVPSLSEADAIRVDLFRESLDDLPVYTTDPSIGPIWAIVAGTTTVNTPVLEVDYRYYPVEREEFSSYPIKTSLQAWQELGEGKGSIVRLIPPDDNNITIRRIYLGYYDSTTKPLQFMQPIYIFEGDNNFLAYVPAVTGEWVQSTTPSPSPQPTP